jgi:hypothetical protein
MSPFLTLDVTPDSTDEEVRAAYTRLLRKYPPEHCPEEFQMIQESATKLRTARDRWLAWFNPSVDEPKSPLEALQSFQKLPARIRPPGFEAFKSLMRDCCAATQKNKK